MTSSNLFGSNSGNSANSNYQRMALDNLLRRELRISDPNDPQQVAQALLSRYKDDPRANAITQEARGLPFLQAAATATSVALTPSSSDAELKQAVDDVNRDLEALLQNSLLKDITPELQGWAQAIRSAMQEGTVAARFALDPRQRDKAFAIRRQLGDYARVARFVGALTPTLNLVYRKFAQSLDEVASILLVLMGEALANVGFSGGRFLLQTPYSELQVRRDAVINALRNLAGSTQTAFGPNEWPRGLDAYRSLFRQLETHGQGDLRSLLVENELSRVMDELIQRAAHGNADGLRALGATARLDLQRFRRLITIGQRSVSPESPPLMAFLEALQLFVDAFDLGGGFRLLRVARPPILFYGLYGIGGLSTADQTLVDLVMLRGRLAEALDCFLVFKTDQIVCQVLLDKILYDVDRAIDLYALGVNDFGEPERRAAAYSFLVDELLNTANNQYCSLKDTEISDFLGDLVHVLRPNLNQTTIEIIELKAFNQAMDDQANDLHFKDELDKFFKEDNSTAYNDLGKLLDSLNNSNKPNIIFYIQIIYYKYTKFKKLLDQVIANSLNPDLMIAPTIPTAMSYTLAIMQEELCIQKEAEKRWENLVRTMAPSCNGFGAFNQIQQLLINAINQIGGECASFEVNLPPHIETSLDSLVHRTDRIGRGRASLISFG